MTGKDKITIEVKGEMIEIPIHLTEIEVKGSWVGNTPPRIVLSTVIMTKEEFKKWARVTETIFK